MTDILYKYLQDEWKLNNLPKYQKHFDTWLKNLTEKQINYYNNIWLNKNK